MTFTDNNAITIKPVPGTFLATTKNVSSNVMLMDVFIETGLCEQDYVSLLLPPRVIRKGEPCIIVSGSILNMNKKKPELIVWAEGYDETGQVVAKTLDAAYIAGQIHLSLGYGTTGEFIMHMNTDANLETIRVFAVSYEFLKH